jgi:LysM repeat protein
LERTDVAMANFRKILKEKQEKNIRRKKLAVSYGTKVAVAMVLFVGAVALKNKTDVIEDMKHQMSTLSVPEDVVETAEEDVMVEELPGNVEEQECLPIENAQDENIQEENAQEENVSEENAPEYFQEQVPITENMTSEPDYQQYTIQKGDTLAKVSRDYYGNDDMVAKICELNEIENGDYIQVGEIILLP